MFERDNSAIGSFSVYTNSTSIIICDALVGNYSICSENLSRTKKVFTLHYTIVRASETPSSQTEELDFKIRNLYLSLSNISTKVEMLKTREAIHYESIV